MKLGGFGMSLLVCAIGSELSILGVLAWHGRSMREGIDGKRLLMFSSFI